MTTLPTSHRLYKLPRRAFLGFAVLITLLGLLMTVQAQDGTLPLPGSARDFAPHQTLSNTAPGFGQRIELDGEWLITSTYSSQLLIYRRNSIGQYVPHSTIAVEDNDDDPNSHPAFGLENNRLFVGVATTDNIEAGKVLIYEPNSSGVWTLITTVRPTTSPLIYRNRFGSIMVADKSGNQFASQLAYRRASNGTWEFAGETSAEVISGDYGLYAYYDDNDLYNEHLYFLEQAVPYWNSIGEDQAFGNGPVGYHKDIEDDVAFASYDEPESGSVFVFNLSGSAWQVGQKIVPGDVTNDPSNQFGYSVAVNGTRLAISSPSDDPNESALYVYEQSGLNWLLDDKIDLPGQGYQFFRYGETDLEDQFVAVGDVGYSVDNQGNDSYAPKIYIFQGDFAVPPTNTPIPTEEPTATEDNIP